MIYGLSQIESAVLKRRMPYFQSIYFQIIQVGPYPGTEGT